MKNYIKSIAFVFSVFLVSPVTILFIVIKSITSNDRHFIGFAQFLSLIPGKAGNYLRLGFFYYVLPVCEKDIVISFLAQFAQRDTELYSGVYIGPQCNIGSCVIDKNTLLGSGVHIMSGKSQHFFEDPKILVKDQGGALQKIRVGQDCWIGNGALIMSNIGDHCVVAAGSVVIDDVPDYSIVAGNPARIVSKRNQ